MNRRSGIGTILFWFLSPLWLGAIVMWAALALIWFVVASPYYIYQAIKNG